MTTATLQPAHGEPRRPSAWPGLLLIGLSVAAVAVLGGLATATSVKTWYPTLSKPAWTPPDWVFGPVWTVLYAMMAAAALLVWRSPDRSRVRPALWAFGGQLFLNLAWSVCFFGLRSPLLGFIDICALWVLIGLTVVQFFLVSRTAGWLMVPYWAWVTFAAALNGSILIRHGT